MNNEWAKIEDLYGISRKETKSLQSIYSTIGKLKYAVLNNKVVGLKFKDVERLKKYFLSSPSGRVCISCKNKLPLILDNGICPHCGVRNINGN